MRFVLGVRRQRNNRALCLTAAAWLFTLATAPVGGAAERIASINLCTDTLLFEIADPATIVSVSTLSSEPGLSYYSERAANYPANRGSAEEIVALAPDLVVTGSETTPTTNALLERLGFRVVAFEPAISLTDYRNNLQRMGELLGRQAAAAALIAEFDAGLAAAAVAAPKVAHAAVIYQANGFSPGRLTLANELLAHAGMQNIAATRGIEFGAHLALERIIEWQPEIFLVSTYARDTPALAHVVLEHPVFRGLHRHLEKTLRVLEISERAWTCGNQFIPSAIAKLRARAGLS